MATNGNHSPDGLDPSVAVAPGKRKRDSIEGDDTGPTAQKDQKELVERCFEALKRYAAHLLARTLSCALGTRD